MNNIKCPAAHRYRNSLLIDRDAAMQMARALRSVSKASHLVAEFVTAARKAQRGALCFKRQGRKPS